MREMNIFAKKIRLSMETITLDFDPNSAFGIALDELLRNSVGVRVVRRTKKLEKASADGLIDEILENAPKDCPLTDEEIQQEINAVRYAL